VRRLLATAYVVPSFPILVTLIMQSLRSSETSVLTVVTGPNIPEHRILQLYLTFSEPVIKQFTRKVASSLMLRRVALVRTDVSKVLSVSFIRVTRIGELGTTLFVTSNRRTLRRNTRRASVASYS
jgi:hypothetical protein